MNHLFQEWRQENPTLCKDWGEAQVEVVEQRRWRPAGWQVTDTAPTREKDGLDWSQGKLRRPWVTRKLSVPRPE